MKVLKIAVAIMQFLIELMMDILHWAMCLPTDIARHRRQKSWRHIIVEMSPEERVNEELRYRLKFGPITIISQSRKPSKEDHTSVVLDQGSSYHYRFWSLRAEMDPTPPEEQVVPLMIDPTLKALEGQRRALLKQIKKNKRLKWEKMWAERRRLKLEAEAKLQSAESKKKTAETRTREALTRLDQSLLVPAILPPPEES